MTLTACPTDCPLAAYATGRYVRIDLDNLPRPASRKLPRRCERCHRLYVPARRGPVSVYCGRPCMNAATQMDRDRDRDRAARRMPTFKPSRTIVDVTGSSRGRRTPDLDPQLAEVLQMLGIHETTEPEAVRGYVSQSLGRRLRAYAQMLRSTQWTSDRADYTDDAAGEAAYRAAVDRTGDDRRMIALLEQEARLADLT